jgi:hypothetical protein
MSSSSLVRVCRLKLYEARLKNASQPQASESRRNLLLSVFYGLITEIRDHTLLGEIITMSKSSKMTFTLL